MLFEPQLGLLPAVLAVDSAAAATTRCSIACLCLCTDGAQGAASAVTAVTQHSGLPCSISYQQHACGAAQCMVGDVTIEWELPDGGLYIMPSRHGAAAAFPEPGENNFRLVRSALLGLCLNWWGCCMQVVKMANEAYGT